MEMHRPAHPGKILKEDCIIALNLSITEAALKLGVNRQNLSDIVNCKTGISPLMALKIAKAFNTTPEIWLNMQVKYDLWKTKQNANLDNVQVLYG